MDINYILGREQTSIHNAELAVHASARASHRGLAKAYGRLLANNVFPHREPITQDLQDRHDDHQLIAEDALSTGTFLERTQIAIERDARSLDCGDRRLAAEFADGRVSPKAFQTRSRFLRQERERISSTLRDAAPPGARSKATASAMLLGTV